MKRYGHEKQLKQKFPPIRGQVGLGMVAGGYLLSAYCTSGP